MSPDPSALNSMRQVDYESVESGNAAPSAFTPSVNPQLTMALPTVESRLNRNELSSVPGAGCHAHGSTVFDAEARLD